MLEKIKGWEIIFDDNESVHERYNEGKDKEEVREVLGLCNFYHNKIYICRGMSFRQKLKVIRHELAHAMAYEYNIDISEDPCEIVANLVESYFEEIVLLDKIATFICNENRDFYSVSYVLDKIKEEKNKEEKIKRITIWESDTKELILDVFKEDGEFKAVSRGDVDFEISDENGDKILERRKEND